MSKMSKAIAVLGVVAGLGVAAMPLSSYAYQQSAPAKVQAEVGGAISITVNTNNATAPGTLDLGELTLGGNINAKALAVTVATNSTTSGTTTPYKLQISMETEETALVNENGQKIEAGAPKKGESKWGYVVGEVPTDLNAASWQTVPAKSAGATVLKPATGEGAGSADQDGETTNVTFGASASATQAQGTYSGTVIFTAVVGE